jgi:hypothetical protein
MCAAGLGRMSSKVNCDCAFQRDQRPAMYRYPSTGAIRSTVCECVDKWTVLDCPMDRDFRPSKFFGQMSIRTRPGSMRGATLTISEPHSVMKHTPWSSSHNSSYIVQWFTPSDVARIANLLAPAPVRRCICSNLAASPRKDPGSDHFGLCRQFLILRGPRSVIAGARSYRYHVPGRHSRRGQKLQKERMPV